MPFGIIAKILSRRLGGKAFDSVWTRLDHEPPPGPRTGESTFIRVVGVQVLRAGITTAVAVSVDRAMSHTFHYFLGVWPKKPPKPTPTPTPTDESA